MSGPGLRPQRPFELVADYAPAGDQPEAIARLTQAFGEGLRDQVLLGVTGSGKTFTVANVIRELGWPVLVLAHNKILAAQLYQEFREFFPRSAVEYFVSYYDYYQPEAYVPSTDTFIEKDSSINEDIERLRLRATTSLLTRRDIIVVASVSCIYGLGSPVEYLRKAVELRPEQNLDRDDFLRSLVDMQYVRSDIDFRRGTFRVRGDVVDVFPAYEDRALRVEFVGDVVETISIRHPLTGEILDVPLTAAVFPARHYQMDGEGMGRALADIRAELDVRLRELSDQGKLLEHERLRSRTLYDIEMLQETGTCAGIENYSRILEGRPPGSPPSTLMDFFEPPWLLVVDESHVTIPQLGGMSHGDLSRKRMLVEHGFRLPCAVDNRPLRLEEFEARMPPALFVSATPGPYELRRTNGEVVELVVRPTGLLDPVIEVRPVDGQIDDLLDEIRSRSQRDERVLVTTLTKRMAEDLTDWLQKAGVAVRWMHSDVDALERAELVRGLRSGDFDVLVGINLLREGLDLPEVSLVAILDADKEGFLRSTTSLIQTAGRASRNLNGTVIFYADKVTSSMKACIDETTRRRAAQMEHNRIHGIEPASVRRRIHERLALAPDPVENSAWRDPGPPGRSRGSRFVARSRKAEPAPLLAAEDPVNIGVLERAMMEAAARLDFEEAAVLRDRLRALRGI